MTQMLAQREHDYFAETAICANCYIVANFFSSRNKTSVLAIIFGYDKRKMDLQWNDLAFFRAWFERSTWFLL